MGTSSPRSLAVLEALLRAVVAEPQAEGRRLVPAGRLEDHSQPGRAELSRSFMEECSRRTPPGGGPACQPRFGSGGPGCLTATRPGGDRVRIDYPVTVLSDLHVGHPASYVTDPDQLAPLFRDAATVVFNGDTVEMLWVGNRDRAQEQMERVARACTGQGARPLFLNGNHDPVVSSASYLDLAGGAVLVTHGDILFHDIAPWSREARHLGPEHTRILAGLGDEARADFEERLVAVRRTALSLEMHEPRTPRGRWAGLATTLREGWPPWRVLRIVGAWVRTPRLADELAGRFRPRARFVVIGHTHFAGVWGRGGRVVVNTGSFLPLSGRYAVRIDPGHLEVRKVERGKGGWVFGRTVAAHDWRGSPRVEG